MIEFIPNGVYINMSDDYAIWMFLSKKLRCSDLDSPLSEVLVTLLEEKEALSFDLLLSLSSFSNSQTLQIPNTIITKYVEAFWVQV